MKTVLSLSGSLETTPMETILKDLYQRKATGEVSFTGEGTKKNVYLKNGLIIYSSSNQEKDRLGNILLDHGLISLAQFEDSNRKVVESGKKQGTVLVQTGAISPKDLFKGLNLQVKEIILSLFGWEKGNYRFIDRLPSQEEIITLRISPAPIILEGVSRRLKASEEFRDRWDGNTLRIAALPDPPWLLEDLRLPQEGRKVFALIEKGTPWATVPSLSGLSEEEATAYLYTFKVLDMVSALPIEESPEPAEAAEKAEESAGAGEYLKEEKEKISAFHAKLDSLNLYQVLRLEPSSSSDLIRESYMTMAKEYHPDRFFGDEDVQGQLNSIFMKINEAYTVLSSPRKREEYDRKEIHLETSKRAGEEPQGDSHVARTQYQKGMKSLKENDLWTAIESFRWAVNLSPQNPTYHTWLGAALARTKKRLHEAEEHCKTAIALDYSNPLFYVHLGQVYKTGRLTKKAREQFETALKLKPDYKQALSALEQLDKAH